jgi:hypothetical protein
LTAGILTPLKCNHDHQWNLLWHRSMAASLSYSKANFY